MQQSKPNNPMWTIRHLPALLLLGLGVILLSACSSKGSPIAPPSPLSEFEPELEVVHRWGQQLAQGSYRYHLKLQTLVDGERVFAASHRGRVDAYASASGERLWQVELDAVLNTGPSDAGERLLFGGVAELIALNKDDGSIAWRAPVSSEVLSLPAWHRDIVVVHGVDGQIFGLDAKSGEQRWRHHENVPSLSLRGTGNPLIIGDEGVLVGTANGKLIALGLHDGRLLWETTIATARGRTELDRISDVDADLAVADGMAYAVSYQGILAAVALGGGQLQWNREIASSTGIVLDRDQLYVSDRDGVVWALARHNGETMWRQPALQYRALSAPVQQGNYLIVGDYDGYLHWLNKEDGRLVARMRIQDWREYWPLEDDTIKLKSAYREDRAVVMPPAVQGVKVFAMDKRGVLDVFEVSRPEAKSQ